MSETGNDFGQLLDSTSHSDKNSNPWLRHGIHTLSILIWEYIAGPRPAKLPKNKDSQFKFIAEQLIATLPEKTDPVTIEATKQLLAQHRTIENTAARRRLERWACRAIITYLICVFTLLILNGVSRIIWPEIFTPDAPLFSDTVLYVILSTTTVNILGLGYIIIKGHFPQKNDKQSLDLEKD